MRPTDSLSWRNECYSLSASFVLFYIVRCDMGFPDKAKFLERRGVSIISSTSASDDIKHVVYSVVIAIQCSNGIMSLLRMNRLIAVSFQDVFKYVIC